MHHVLVYLGRLAFKTVQICRKNQNPSVALAITVEMRLSLLPFVVVNCGLNNG